MKSSKYDDLPQIGKEPKFSDEGLAGNGLDPRASFSCHALFIKKHAFFFPPKWKGNCKNGKSWKDRRMAIK